MPYPEIVEFLGPSIDDTTRISFRVGALTISMYGTRGEHLSVMRSLEGQFRAVYQLPPHVPITDQPRPLAEPYQPTPEELAPDEPLSIVPLCGHCGKTATVAVCGERLPSLCQECMNEIPF